MFIKLSLVDMQCNGNMGKDQGGIGRDANMNSPLRDLTCQREPSRSCFMRDCKAAWEIWHNIIWG